jgi:membrane protein DedA with SNARE-associated domain
MIQIVIDWLVGTISILGYPGVFVAVFIESFFAPIPSELILPFSGFVAFQGSMNVYIVIFVATIGSYLGSLPFYFLGRWGEKNLLQFLSRYGKYFFIEQTDVDWIFKLFERFGKSLVLFGRLIPIVRTLISFPAGVAKMPFILFTAFTVVGSMLWNIFLVYAGYLMGNNWEIVKELVEKYESTILVLVFVFFLIYIGRGLYRMLKRREK